MWRALGPGLQAAPEPASIERGRRHNFAPALREPVCRLRERRVQNLQRRSLEATEFSIGDTVDDPNTSLSVSRTTGEKLPRSSATTLAKDRILQRHSAASGEDDEAAAAAAAAGAALPDFSAGGCVDTCPLRSDSDGEALRRYGCAICQQFEGHGEPYACEKQHVEADALSEGPDASAHHLRQDKLGLCGVLRCFLGRPRGSFQHVASDGEKGGQGAQHPLDAADAGFFRGCDDARNYGCQVAGARLFHGTSDDSLERFLALVGQALERRCKPGFQRNVQHLLRPLLRVQLGKGARKERKLIQELAQDSGAIISRFHAVLKARVLVLLALHFGVRVQAGSARDLAHPRNARRLGVGAVEARGDADVVIHVRENRLAPPGAPLAKEGGGVFKLIRHPSQGCPVRGQGRQQEMIQDGHIAVEEPSAARHEGAPRSLELRSRKRGRRRVQIHFRLGGLCLSIGFSRAVHGRPRRFVQGTREAAHRSTRRAGKVDHELRDPRLESLQSPGLHPRPDSLDLLLQIGQGLCEVGVKRLDGVGPEAHPPAQGLSAVEMQVDADHLGELLGHGRVLVRSLGRVSLEPSQPKQMVARDELVFESAVRHLQPLLQPMLQVPHDAHGLDPYRSEGAQVSVLQQDTGGVAVDRDRMRLVAVRDGALELLGQAEQEAQSLQDALHADQLVHLGEGGPHGHLHGICGLGDALHVREQSAHLVIHARHVRLHAADGVCGRDELAVVLVHQHLQLAVQHLDVVHHGVVRLEERLQPSVVQEVAHVAQRVELRIVDAQETARRARSHRFGFCRQRVRIRFQAGLGRGHAVVHGEHVAHAVIFAPLSIHI
eukprot:scaffold48_cov311-Pinguiococcus_pyrenoidosus.AAC.42